MLTQAVLDAVPIGVVVTDASGRAHVINAAARRILGPGVDRDGWSLSDVVEGADRSQLQLTHRAALEEGVSSSWRHRLSSVDGDGVWVRHSVAPLRGPDGAVEGVVSTFSDVTDEHEMELALEGSRDFTSAVLDTVGAFVVVLDAKGRILRLNDAMLGLGIEAASIVGRGMFDSEVVPAEHREIVERAFSAMLRDELGTIEVDMPLPSGRRRVVWNATTHRDADGEVRSVIATGVDITELRELEARVARHDRLDSISRLTAGVAHDFGNTLATIGLRLERLRTMHDPTAQADLDAIERTVARATDLIRDLVSFSRPAAQPALVVKIDEQIAIAVAAARDVVSSSVRIVVDAGASDGSVSADPTRLTRALVNLCTNADDAMPGGGTLTISSRVVALDVARRPSELSSSQLPDGDYVEIVVADTGIGIDRAHLAKVFEPYFSTKMSSGGTGLGLATVYGTVIETGGGIHVESVPGAGAAFTVWLPLVATPDRQIE